MNVAHIRVGRQRRARANLTSGVETIRLGLLSSRMGWTTELRESCRIESLGVCLYGGFGFYRSGISRDSGWIYANVFRQAQRATF